MKTFVMKFTFAMCLGITTLASAFGQARPKEPKYTVVPLNLTVENQDSLGNATKVIGDSVGNTYANGAQGVCATFNQSGDLIIDFDCAASAVQRNLVFIVD